MGWHTETSDPDAKFAYSPNRWTDDKLGLEWLDTLTSIPGIGRVVPDVPAYLSSTDTTHTSPSNFVSILSTITLNSSVFRLIRHISSSLSTLVSSGLCKNITVKLQMITYETHLPLLSRVHSGSFTAPSTDKSTPQHI